MTREDYLTMAKLAQEAKRYYETVHIVDRLVRCSPAGIVVRSTSDLTPEQCKLLATAYKQVISPLREAWKKSLQFMYENQGDEDCVAIINYSIHRIESRLFEICTRILNLLDSNLIPSASTSESKVFYLKMKGDYNRYLAEFEVGVEREKATTAAMNAYRKAQRIACSNLAPTHPTRLGMTLNFTIFYYEIVDDYAKAFSVATKAYDKATANSGMNCCKEGKLILQLIRDNLKAWTSGFENKLH